MRGLEAVDGGERYRSRREAELTARQTKILEAVRSQGFITIEALAEDFETSAQTIRREIIKLTDIGMLRRFHGGAGLPDQSARAANEPRVEIAAEARDRIGRAVARLLPEQASVFLDPGLAGEAVAHAIRNRPRLRAFTASLGVAAILASNESAEVFVLGGVLRGSDGSLVGDLPVSVLERIKVDVAILACSGFDEDGSPMDFDSLKVSVKQAALRSARLVMIVVDSGTFGANGVLRVAPAAKIHTVVAPTAPPPWLEAAFAAAGTRVMIAE